MTGKASTYSLSSFVLATGITLLLSIGLGYSYLSQRRVAQSKHKVKAWEGVADINEFPDICTMSNCQSWDAIVSLGGGPAIGDELPIWTVARVKVAAQIYKCCQAYRPAGKNIKIITTSAGTAHAPNPLDQDGFYITEAKAAADWLIREGVPKSDIYQETASWDTIGNAYFVRTIHTDVRGWRSLLMITSDYHMDRSKAIFEWIMGLAGPGPAYRVDTLAVSDEGVDKEVVTDRRRREAASLVKLKQRAAELRSLEAVHEWLFTGHQAYASGATMERLQGKDRRIYNGR